MGAWGIGALENDDALDWLGDLPASDGWNPVRQALREVDLGEPPAAACTRALAAAELVAAGRGHPVEGLPESAVRWLATAGTLPPEELGSRAVAAVAKIRSASELRTLFKEGDELKSWSGELRRLDARLKKEIRPTKIDQRPAPPEELFKRVDREIKAERWEEAIATLTKILDRVPDRVVSFNNRAWCLAHVGRLADASVDIERAMELLQRIMSPNLVKASCYGTRGFIRLQGRNYDEAIEDLSLSLSINPVRINFEHRAQAYEALGQHALAAADQQSARALLVTESLQRARSAWDKDLYREALAELNRVIEIEPAHERARFRRAMVLWQLKFMKEAEQDLSKLIEMSPGERYLYFRRAEVRAILGERGAAREDRVRCHELGLDLIAFYNEFIERQVRDIGRGIPLRVKKSVIPQLSFLLKLVPEHARAREVRAQAFDFLGNPRRAAQDHKMLVGIKPLPPPAPAPDDTTYHQWFWTMMGTESLL
jgi:tetratricopeptide (TPR) repeat protein